MSQQQETPRTFTPEQAKAMYAFIDTYILTHMKTHFAAQLMIDDVPDYEVAYGIPAQAIMDLRADLYTLQALATPPAATEPAQEAGDVRSLKNRNTETFEAVAEYHRGNFYAAPVLYHNREIMCWHVYDKTDDKDKYCVARNIRTRLLAIAHIDRLNARARGGA